MNAADGALVGVLAAAGTDISGCGMERALPMIAAAHPEFRAIGDVERRLVPCPVGPPRQRSDLAGHPKQRSRSLARSHTPCQCPLTISSALGPRPDAPTAAIRRRAFRDRAIARHAVAR